MRLHQCDGLEMRGAKPREAGQVMSDCLHLPAKRGLITKYVFACACT